ncbi:MAG: tyrosine-type recombinase/integrase [Planctomycetes bacterium]|nr:tyrosine-type recombinase/integrase [Planctomycetota bacterium]
MRLRGQVYYGQVRLASGEWKHVRLSKDLGVAKSLLGEWQRDADLGKFDGKAKAKGQRDGVDLLKLIKKFEDASEGVSTRYREQIRQDATLVFEALPSPVLEQFTHENLLRVRHDLANNRHGRARSNRTRNRIMESALRVVRWGMEVGIVPAHPNPVPNLKALPLRSHNQVRHRHALSLEEARRLAAAAVTFDSGQEHLVPQAPLFELLIGTGFRFSEAERLCWCDMSLDRTTGRTYLRVRQSKNGMPRTNGISPELAETLHRLRTTQARIFGHLPGADEPILLAPDGQPWRDDKYRAIHSGRLFRRVRELAGLPSPYPDGEVLDWHSLRHSYCCFLRENGVDVGTAATMMGHRTLAMTQRIYSRYDRIEKQGALDALPVLRPTRVSTSCQN